MANWRREREATTVHVVPEAAPALCGVEREALGLMVWDADQVATDLCVACSRKMLEVTDEAVRRSERIATEADLEAAKVALRGLLRLVPDGPTRDLVVYARACLARNDKKGAHESIRQWRANMRAIGVLPG